MVSKDSLFFTPSRNGEISLFSCDICQQVEGSTSVENRGVQRQSLLPPERNGGNFPIFETPGKTPSKPEGRIVTSATSRTGDFPPYFYLGEWIESPRKGFFFAHLLVLSFRLCLKTRSFLLTYLPTFKLLIYFFSSYAKNLQDKR